jgi:hypothetical protein
MLKNLENLSTWKIEYIFNFERQAVRACQNAWV